MPKLRVKPPKRVILSAHGWTSNAELIADVASLGYLRRSWTILDPTYSKGVWWKRWRPDAGLLIGHDLYEGPAMDGIDFRHLPEADESVDAFAFDPPYVSVGGRDTSTMPEFNSAYGLTRAPKSPLALLHTLIFPGMREGVRVLRKGGIMLVKAMPYVSSGNTVPATHLVFAFATQELGLKYVDEFVHVGRIRPQPERFRTVDGKKVRSIQQHPRHNASTLYIFRKRTR